MLHFILLTLSLFLLFFVAKKIVSLEKMKSKSILKEAKQNAFMLLWGAVLIFLLLFIPYQVWKLTGSSHGWDGVYIVGGAEIITISLLFYYYNKVKIRFK